IDELHLRKRRESLDPAGEIVARKRHALALDELHDASALEVDGGDQHRGGRREEAGGREVPGSRRTAIPLSRRYAFRAATAWSLKWNTDAASAASARPVVKTSTKCSNVPAPPDAITGIDTADETAAVSRQSKPARVPSRSIDVSRISPAPRSAASRAHSI